MGGITLYAGILAQWFEMLLLLRYYGRQWHCIWCNATFKGVMVRCTDITQLSLTNYWTDNLNSCGIRTKLPISFLNGYKQQKIYINNNKHNKLHFH